MACEEEPMASCGCGSEAEAKQTICGHCGMPLDAEYATCDACGEPVCEFCDGEACPA